MIRRMYWFVLCVVLLGNSARAQEAPKTEKATPEETANARSEALYQRFATTAAELKLESTSEEVYQWEKTPLFRFSSDGNTYGSVYVWKDSVDRLAAVGTIGSIPIGGNDVEFVEFHLLKPTPIKPLRIAGNPGKVWSPQVDSLVLRGVPNAPAVAANPASRLIQMRAMARSFSATMYRDNQTNKLRLLPQPIDRYKNSSPQYDGALFAFVWDIGTDPELLLRFEIDSEDDKPVWKYQPVRFTYRHLELQHDGTKVWEEKEFLERNQTQQVTPYLTGLTTVIP
jgi:hypothetical protein